MTVDPTTRQHAIDAMARAAYAHEHVLIGGDWDRIGQDERDYWTRHAAVQYDAMAPIVLAELEQLRQQLAEANDQIEPFGECRDDCDCGDHKGPRPCICHVTGDEAREWIEREQGYVETAERERDGAREQVAALSRDLKTAHAELASLTSYVAELIRDRDTATSELRDVTTGLRTRLAAHYLAQVVCDHDRKADNPICACSRVHLGWHPSVGEAVTAWIDHVLAVVEPAAGGAGETPEDAVVALLQPSMFSPNVQKVINELFEAGITVDVSLRQRLIKAMEEPLAERKAARVAARKRPDAAPDSAETEEATA